MPFKICIIEDDADLAALTKEYLTKYGFEVLLCEDFNNISTFIETHMPQLILLDISLPYYDGFYWCTEIRRKTLAPILFVSARGEEHDQIRAILSGGDDYITKPFSYDLLLTKVNSQLRRSYGEYANADSSQQCGDCSFHKQRFILCCKDKQVDLSKNEAILVGLLFEHYPNIVKREKILSEIWDSELFVEENTLNVSISRVRKKLKELGSKLQVLSIRGMGYKVDYVE